MTPRVSPTRPPRQAPGSSYGEWREDVAPLETRAFWNWLTAPNQGFDAREMMVEEEQRVLSKGASGGGFLVPTDLAEQIVSAARAQSALAQLALELVTSDGASMGLPLAGTHGTAAWTAESGSYTPSDETITQVSLSAFKGTSKLIVSEELLRDEEVQLDAHLAQELGARLGALQGAAFATGDGSGKPLGITNAGSGYSTVTAATGSSLLFKVADFVSALKALPAQYRQNAAWVMNPDDAASIAGTTDTAGALAVQSMSFSPPSLLGLPVFLDANIRTGTTRVLPTPLRRQRHDRADQRAAPHVTWRHVHTRRAADRPEGIPHRKPGPCATS